jgi:hypothetical protein
MPDTGTFATALSDLQVDARGAARIAAAAKTLFERNVSKPTRDPDIDAALLRATSLLEYARDALYRQATAEARRMELQYEERRSPRHKANAPPRPAAPTPDSRASKQESTRSATRSAQSRAS